MNDLDITASSAARAGVTPASIGRFRYYILGLIFCVTVLNYADRATLSITGTAVAHDLGLSPAALGVVFSAFGWAYAIGQIPGGWLLDRFGARRVYGLSIVLWSLFTLSQGMVTVFSTAASATVALFIMRFMLGLVESPAFPGNARIVATWFPTAERGTASALFNSAQYLAVVLFTPLMAWLTHVLSWHQVFFIMGALGLVSACVWFATMGDPKTHPRMRRSELDFISANGALVGLDAVAVADQRRFTGREISTLFTSRMLWAIYIGQYCITALTYFFITWFAALPGASWVARCPTSSSAKVSQRQRHGRHRSCSAWRSPRPLWPRRLCIPTPLWCSSCRWRFSARDWAPSAGQWSQTSRRER